MVGVLCHVSDVLCLVNNLLCMVVDVLCHACDVLCQRHDVRYPVCTVRQWVFVVLCNVNDVLAMSLCLMLSSMRMMFFMFAIECASTFRKCGCSSFDVETITMNSGYRGWYRANFIAVWYARQAIPKRSRIYI